MGKSAFILFLPCALAWWKRLPFKNYERSADITQAFCRSDHLPYNEFVQYDLSCFPDTFRFDPADPTNINPPQCDEDGTQCDGADDECDVDDACYYNTGTTDDPGTVKIFNDGDKCHYSCLGDMKYSDNKLNKTKMNDYEVPVGYMGSASGLDAAVTPNRHFVTCQCFDTNSEALVNAGTEGDVGTETEGNPKHTPQPKVCIWVFHPTADKGEDAYGTGEHAGRYHVERKNYNHDEYHGLKDTSDGTVVASTDDCDTGTGSASDCTANTAGLFLMCGYKLYYDHYRQNKLNYDFITTETERVKSEMVTKFENYRQIDPDCDSTVVACPVTTELANAEVVDSGYFNKTIEEEQELAIIAYDNAKEQVDLRISEDQRITDEINDKIDKSVRNDTSYLKTEFDATKEAICQQSEDTYMSLYASMDTTLTEALPVLKEYIETESEAIGNSVQNRLDQWKADLITYTNQQASIVKLALDGIIADARISGIGIVTSQIDSEQPVLEQQIRNIGDTCIQLSRSKVAEEVATASEFDITANLTEECTKAEAENLPLVGKLNETLNEEIDGLIAQEEADLLQASAQIDQLKIDLLKQISNTKQNETDLIDTETTTMLADANAFTASKNDDVTLVVKTKFLETAEEIDRENRLARDEALNVAIMHADDIQRKLEHKLEHKLADERDKTREDLTKCRNDLAIRFKTITDKTTSTIADVTDRMNGTSTADLASISTKVAQRSAEFSNNVLQVRTTYCNMIDMNGNGTAAVILNMKQLIREKIQEIVDDVKFGMKHSREQIRKLEMNHFFSTTST